MCHYLITVEFDDGQLATTQYSSPGDVRSKLAEVVNDLTDEDGIEHFRSVTVTQSCRKAQRAWAGHAPSGFTRVMALPGPRRYAFRSQAIRHVAVAIPDVR